MKLRTSFCNRWRLPFSALLMMTFMFACSVAPAANKKEEEKKEAPKYVVTGRDPKAFADAADMLVIPNQTLLDDQTAGKLLGSLEAATKKGDVWSLAIWSQLDGLRSIRMSATWVQALQNVGQKIIIKETRPSVDKLAAARRAFKQGNRHYEEGKFEQAVESYRSALTEHPAYWDAWNNMALAEMHSNNNIVALFLLSALRKNNPKYLGASINLSVCLERLGQDDVAYNVAADLVSEPTQMPMAQYNMAWFENSRGKYDSASGYLGRALATVDNYTAAKWLQTINTMESGRNVTDEEMKSLPPADQGQGTPKIISRSVVVSMADAYSGDIIVVRIEKGTHLVISRQSGDWYGFYWPVEDTKRLLWTHKTSFGELIKTASNDLKAFLGTWTGKWGNIPKEIRITETSGKPSVTMYEDKVSDEKLENGCLTFNVEIKDSGWKFVYTLTPTPWGLKMDVFRLRDSQRFSGTLTKK